MAHSRNSTKLMLKDMQTLSPSLKTMDTETRVEVEMSVT